SYFFYSQNCDKLNPYKTNGKPLLNNSQRREQLRALLPTLLARPNMPKKMGKCTDEKTICN
ncbi:hypothetical protein, partial [Prevotella corporis]|uniref:hypothetical protein n=1 Tax=Prevotella corporis TaxID=28128 RepID=UPI0023F0D9E8